VNKTAIEWTDYTWNPVTGCLGPKGDGVRCPYCYAQRLAKRFYSTPQRMERVPMAGDSWDPFAPRSWPMRGDEPVRLKKPSKIFVSSLGELFGPWVDDTLIARILRIAFRCERHTFQFLTKWPDRLARWNPWPPNAWVGATATTGWELAKATVLLSAVKASVRYVSLEPLLAPVDPRDIIGLDWLIIGAQTGPNAQPIDRQDVRGLLDAADRYGVPVFVKNNVRWPEKRQEWPSLGTEGGTL
jgi:protein gp37